jgi:hypothetical protein
MSDYTLKINDENVEEGHVAHAKVELNAPLPYDLKVYYKTEEGSAKSPEDYHGKADGYVVIPAHKGWETVDVQTVADKLKEGDEYFKVKIWVDEYNTPTPSSTATKLTATDHYKVEVKDNEGKVTIIDDKKYDEVGKVHIKDGEAKEGEYVKFDIWNSGHEPAKVQYYTEKWTANANGDSDYKPTSGEFWLAKDEHREVRVETYKDHEKEGAEQFKLWVMGNDHYGTGTIHDYYDVPTPTFTATDVSPIA